MRYFAHLNLSVAFFLAFGSYTVTTVVIEARQSAVSNPPCASIIQFHFGKPCMQVGCTVLAAFTQYFWLSAFCWMMCEGLVICFKVVVVFGSLEGKWYIFLLLGWGMCQPMLYNLPVYWIDPNPYSPPHATCCYRIGSKE